MQEQTGSAHGAYIYQGVGGVAEINYAVQRQTGTEHTAATIQMGTGHHATILQFD